MQLDALEPGSIEAIAALARRALVDPPTADEISRGFGAPDQPGVWYGDPARGVIGAVRSGEAGFIRFLAVDPDHRGAGLGRALVGRAEAALAEAGARSVTVGADAPYYLWPGIDARELATVCLFERLRYARVDVHLNMDVDLDRLPPDPGGWRVATPADRETVAAWAERHWSFWTAEMLRALDQDGLVLAEDPEGIAAVCAAEVNRAGLVGPVAVRPAAMGRGLGVAPLLGTLHRMRASGRTRAEISWVGPVVPYARVGGTLGRTFLVYRKELA
ncbi:MAG: GNAT family N-acetyltransferase [Acidimicrobiia bacterium]